MKNVSLVLNVVLLIAVGVLYVLHFGSNKSNASVTPNAASKGEMRKIAYVNIDSLLANFDMYKELVKEFDSKKSQMEAEIGVKAKGLDKQVMDYQDKAQKGLITRYQAAETEKSLREQEQKLMGIKQEMEYRLMDEQGVMTRRIHNQIMEYLKKYNSNNNFSYILSNSYGGPFLYTDSTLNITTDVLSGLNTDYQLNKTKK